MRDEEEKSESGMVNGRIGDCVGDGYEGFKDVVWLEWQWKTCSWKITFLEIKTVLVWKTYSLYPLIPKGYTIKYALSSSVLKFGSTMKKSGSIC